MNETVVIMLRYLYLGLALAAAVSAADLARSDAETVESTAGVYLDEILDSADIVEAESVDTEVSGISYSLPDERIVGGSLASIEQHPWQLSLRKSLVHACGAILISENWALSAAHCTERAIVVQLSLRAGTANRLLGGAIRGVTRVINHPGFVREEFINDISLLETAGAFELSSTIRPVALPQQGQDVPAGTFAWVTGWGTTHSDTQTITNFLLQIFVPVVDQDICFRNYFGRITPQMLCAGYLEGGMDACRGDSGGPLVTDDGTLIGVVSWGRRCAAPNFPGVYTRVSAYRDWILENSGV